MNAVPSAEVKASTKGYTKAGILGLLTGLAIVALGAFVVTGRVVADDTDADVVSEGAEFPLERDPSITRALGQPIANGANVAVETTTTVAPITTTTIEAADPPTTTTTLPQVIIDPGLLDDDAADGGEDDDAEDDPAAPTTTTTSTTTTSTTTSTTTTTPTTTTIAAGTPTPLAQEMDRILNLLPSELEDLLIEIEVLDDQLSFGVGSEEDAGTLDEFLSEVTTAPYSIRLAEG